MILVSPTERQNVVDALHNALRRAVLNDPRGKWHEDIPVERSLVPEKRGVDFLWRGAGKWWGIQRKALPDLIASFYDDRLRTEVMQMQAHITMPHLVIEGRLNTDNNGNLMVDDWGRQVAMSTFRNRLLSIGYEGVYISYTRDIPGTAALIVDAYAWSQRASHSTIQSRPKPTNDWGKLSNREYQIDLLTRLPPVGVKTANAILDHFGRLPFALDVTYDELIKVPGVGPKTAKAILAIFEKEKE